MQSPIQTARRLRREMTGPETVLWNELRNRRFENRKFRRKHPIIYEVTDDHKKFYVADFYCAEGKLVIELEGKHHEFSDQKEFERARELIRKEMGIRILHLTNSEFFPLSHTLQKIATALNETSS